MQEVAPGVLELSGAMALPEAIDVLELRVEDADEEADTIGGYVVARLGRLPRRGDEVTIGRHRVVVTDVVRRRVSRLRFEPRKGVAQSGAPVPSEGGSSGA